MKGLHNVSSLHSIAEAYGKRPSEILGLETPWGMWQLDQVTLLVGRRVERNLNDNKPAFDGFHSLVTPSPQAGFRSAKHLVRKKVRIKEDGTWQYS